MSDGTTADTVFAEEKTVLDVPTALEGSSGILHVCPKEMPGPGEPCDFPGTCSYGEECCCGQCYAETEVICNAGHTMVLPTDACMSGGPCVWSDVPSDCVSACAERECGDDGCGGTCGECSGEQLCLDGVCLCVVGETCQPGEELDWACGDAPGPCTEWGCAEGCCVAVDMAPPACCISAAQCRDCYSPSTHEEIPCPDAIPKGFMEDLCTLDACVDFHCMNLDKVEGGYCGDLSGCGDCDDCDHLTGECTSMVKCPCCPHYCWGPTPEEADLMCDDMEVCTHEHCGYPAGAFVPRDDKMPPQEYLDCWSGRGECPPLPDNIYACMCEDVALAGLCDDSDPCTLETCQLGKGCLSVPDPECE